MVNETEILANANKRQGRFIMGVKREMKKYVECLGFKMVFMTKDEYKKWKKEYDKEWKKIKKQF